MQELMQQRPMFLSSLLEHAPRCDAGTEIVSRAFGDFTSSTKFMRDRRNIAPTMSAQPLLITCASFSLVALKYLWMKSAKIASRRAIQIFRSAK